MDFFLRFLTLNTVWFTAPLIMSAILFRFRWYKPITWRYSMAALLARHGFGAHSVGPAVLHGMQIVLFILLAFFIAKPQLVDERSLMPVQGIDIVLVLDASGSMQFSDDENDQRSRFQVAKDEAIRFVQKRDNDAIGLVIFGNDALTRSPITHDKNILEQSIRELKLGFLDPDGTVLATGMNTALNRLRYSKAKSKIMIVLTDGEPSDNDQNPDIPIEVAKQLGVKIYTIGIGAEKPRRAMYPPYGIIIIPTVNRKLLERIADETGGRFFQAKNPHDMRMIYDTIDTLERDEHTVPLYSRYYELFAWYGFTLLILVTAMMILSTCVWFRL